MALRVPVVRRARAERHAVVTGGPTITVVSTVHQLLGYVAALVVLTAGVVGLIQAREARPFRPQVYVIATIVLDVQVLGGLAIYLLGGYRGHDSLSVRLVHPVLAVLALAAAHIGLKRSRRQDGNVAAHRTAAGGFLLALLAVLLGIVALSAGLRA